ncbi:MAG TPA: MCE family protein [Mycobacteriales bacterium]|nr:MCE family protein [Mycobacteriales bacterium]
MTPFRERNKTVIGLAGIGTILTLVVGSFKTDALPLIGCGTHYKADFTEAAGLQKMDEVRVAGVKVGKVTDFKLAGDHIVVTMCVKDVDLGALTRADIKIKTVLGRKYMALTSDGDGSLDPDRTIPTSRTSSPFDVSPAFQQLARTVGGIDTEKLAQSFTVLADDFRNSSSQVRASLDGLSRLSATIASRDDKLRQLLIRAQGVTDVLASRDEDLVAFLQQADLVLQEVKARRAAIHRLLVTTTELSEQLTALVRENRAALAPALRHLRAVAAVLKKNEQNLDVALPRMAAFVRLFANNLGNGRWFDTYVYNLTNPSGFGPGSF